MAMALLPAAAPWNVSSTSAVVSSSSSRFEPFAENPQYGYLILLFIPILTILGNALVILAVLGDKQLKKSVTNRYIAALAFSDLLIGAIPMPLAVYVKVNGEQWNLGVGLCKFYVACDVTSSTASILHLLVISGDRYLAISWPAEYQRYARKAKITFAIVLVWLISITLSIPIVMGKSILDTESCWLDNPEYMIYSSLLSFYIPAGVLILVYVKIFRKIRVRQGIHKMLRVGRASCGSDVAPFHLPFVVVQEVSFDDHHPPHPYPPTPNGQPLLPRHMSTPVNSEATVSSPIPYEGRRSLNLNNNTTTDGRGFYQLVKVKEEESLDQFDDEPTPTAAKAAVTKSRTFPCGFVDDTDVAPLFPSGGEHHHHQGRRRKAAVRGRSLAPEDMDGWSKQTEDIEEKPQIDMGMPESYIGRRGGGGGRRQKSEDGVRLLIRTSSEKRLNKDRGGGAGGADGRARHHRRLSLWYHHSCQHIGNFTSNGGCIVIEDEGVDEEEDEEVTTTTIEEKMLPPLPPPAKSNPVHAGRRILTKALGSSVLSLKPIRNIRQRTTRRRTSSPLDPKFDSSVIENPLHHQQQQPQHLLTIDPPPPPTSTISASSSADFDESEAFESQIRTSSVQVDDEEDEDEHVAAVYALPSSVVANKTRRAAGWNLKKLAGRITNALHRITETQAVTKEKKATKLVALILAIFVISWLPFFTFNTVRGICLSATSAVSDCEWLNSQVFFLTSWLGYANSSFNPIVYALVNQHFRRTYKRLLGWPLKRRY